MSHNLSMNGWYNLRHFSADARTAEHRGLLGPAWAF
jgi:hypothetical protein